VINVGDPGESFQGKFRGISGGKEMARGKVLDLSWTDGQAKTLINVNMSSLKIN